IINAQRQVTTGPTLGRRRPVGSDQQAIGSFRTLRTMVTVRIGTVRIINDSDDGGSGELAFTFTINGSYRFEAGTGLAEVSPGALLDLSDGDTYTFARDIMDANAG